MHIRRFIINIYLQTENYCRKTHKGPLRYLHDDIAIINLIPHMWRIPHHLGNTCKQVDSVIGRKGRVGKEFPLCRHPGVPWRQGCLRALDRFWHPGRERARNSSTMFMAPAAGLLENQSGTFFKHLKTTLYLLKNSKDINCHSTPQDGLYHPLFKCQSLHSVDQEFEPHHYVMSTGLDDMVVPAKLTFPC